MIPKALFSQSLILFFYCALDKITVLMRSHFSPIAGKLNNSMSFPHHLCGSLMWGDSRTEDSDLEFIEQDKQLFSGVGSFKIPLKHFVCLQYWE